MHKGEMQVMNPTATLQMNDQTQNCCGAWWAVYTRHQHEKSVAGMLENKGFEVFLPVYESERRWKDRATTILLPLFPSYVFVRGELNRRLQIVSTPGAHMIVSNGSQFCEIPDQEISAIRRAVESPNRIEPHPALNMGDRVRVVRGALEGLQGILLRKRSSCRLILNVAMLAQSAAVEVNALDVELLEPKHSANGFAGQEQKTNWTTEGNLGRHAVAAAL